MNAPARSKENVSSRMKNNLILMAAVAALSAAAAKADVLWSTQTLSIPGFDVNSAQSLLFNQYDPASNFGLPLTRVVYTFNGSVSISYGIENFNEGATTTYSGTLGTTVVANRPDNTQILLANPNQVINPTILATYDGNFNFDGASGDSYSPVIPYSDSFNSTAPIDLAIFTGTGTVSIKVGGTNATSINLSGGSPLQNGPTASVASTVTVELYYNPVPEPSTYAAIGFAAVVAGTTVWRRRQAAKKA